MDGGCKEALVIAWSLLEEDDYYPFGLTMAGISDKASRTQYVENKYGYSSKELQSKEFIDGAGLEVYDFHARIQDPQIGRFAQIDPKCEIFAHYNPYSYCFDNPLLFVDPDGMQASYNWKTGEYEDKDANGKTVTVSWDQVQEQYQLADYASTASVLVAPEFESDGKTEKNDYGTGALTTVVNAAMNTEGTIKVLHVKNANDAANQIEGISGKITNLLFLSHGDAKNQHQAYFAIGTEALHASDVSGSRSLERIAKKMASTLGPLPSASEVVLFACGAGGTYNGGVELLKALAKKLHSTVYGNQSWSLANANMFIGNSPFFQANSHLDANHSPQNFSNAYRDAGKWTRAYEFGSTQVSQTIYNVYLDSFGKIHYAQ